MLLEVSTGEALDKLTILEIKSNRIQSEEKKMAIAKEIDTLAHVIELKKRYPFEYAFLLYINEEIWDLTEVFCSARVNVSLRIFELNQQRTGSKHCVIIADVDPCVKVADIASILFDYDTFSFNEPCAFRPFSVFIDSAPTIHTEVMLSDIVAPQTFLDRVGKFLR